MPQRKIELTQSKDLTNWHWQILEWTDKPKIWDQDGVTVWQWGTENGHWFATSRVGIEDSPKMAYYAAIEALQLLQDEDKCQI